MLLAKNILACQEAYRHWNELQAEAAHLEQQCGEQLTEIARSLALHGYQTADVEAAAAQVEELDHRRAQRNAAAAELKTCEKERRRLAGEETGRSPKRPNSSRRHELPQTTKRSFFADWNSCRDFRKPKRPSSGRDATWNSPRGIWAM